MTVLFIAGLVTGCITAISALGLVLTYVSSRVFNFAHGMFGLLSAWCFYQFNHVWNWPIWAAALLAIGVIPPVLGLTLWAVVFRKLSRASTVVKLAATIGLSVVVPPLMVVLFGTPVVTSPTGLAGNSTRLIRVLGVNLNMNQVLVIGLAVVIAIAMTVLIRGTGFGLAVRATVDSPTVSALQGTNPDFVQATSWMVGTTLAALSGVLLLPLLALETASYQLAFVTCFAAAVIGRMRSLTVTFVGAIAIGIIQELSGKYLPQNEYLTGLRTCVPFFVMMAVLVFYNFWRRDRRPVQEPPMITEDLKQDLSTKRTFSGRNVAYVLFVAVLLLLPFLIQPFWLGLVSVGVAMGIIFLSFTVVTGMGSGISLAQISFAAVGALTAAELANYHGWPVALAIPAAGVVAVPFGLLIALPAMRWAGLYLALGTLAFAFLVENLIFGIPRYNNFGSGISLPRPSLFGYDFWDDTSFLYLTLAVFAILAFLVVRLRSSTQGMLLGAVRGSERATAAMGYSTFRAKLYLFGFSSFIAGIGGGMYASYGGRATPPQFAAMLGVALMAVIVTFGTRSVLAALLAGTLFTVMPQLFSYFLSPGWQQVPAILFGLGAVGLANEPRGFLVHVTGGIQGLARRVRGPARDPGSDAGGPGGTPVVGPRELAVKSGASS
ncbi:ABC transporter permease [Dactylosporangium sucinum]|uniref:ABC transporter permease n=1 Tax=Dactylosporangium sucinum TaxID=1424081 RepID=A0A917X372_9ACTN|nr:ABC transporter permease [Dactylosporangium sucinum]GGM64597.1 ABC transporter permease [Dactylosporangium sucinum]